MQHLVTGGTGFLGNLIAKELLKKGEKVRILDIIDDPNRPKEIEFIHADILDRDAVKRAMKGVDIVHHNVALVPLTKSGKKFWDVNVTGSDIAAEEAVNAGVQAFVHMSSSAIFGVPKSCPITNQTPTNPIEIYGRGKLAGELAVRKRCDDAKLPLIVIRPRTILGDERLGIFKVLFDWISENKNIYVIGDGNILFQFVHALDLMSFYMLALEKQKPGAYNVGTPYFRTLREDLESLIQFAGSKSKVVGVPAGLTINSLRLLDWLGLSPLAPWHYLTYHKAFHFDVNPLLDMGWQPQYSNQRMMEESYQWYLDHRNDDTDITRLSVHRKPIKEKFLWLLKKVS